MEKIKTSIFNINDDEIIFKNDFKIKDKKSTLYTLIMVLKKTQLAKYLLIDII